MTRLGSEATVIQLHAFIFLCRTNPWVKYPRNSILFLNYLRGITRNVNKNFKYTLRYFKEFLKKVEEN